MKQFACGDVVPGCDARWVAEDDDQILAAVAEHAAGAHQIHDVTPELVEAVREHITVSA
mgnify:CR=1 FL=1